MKDRNNNLEQQLADKLGNRSIAPSGEAWERIARNREQGRYKKKKKRAYLYYAASVILLLLFGSYFFMAESNTVSIDTAPQIVNSGGVEKKERTGETVKEPEYTLPLKHREAVLAYKINREQNAGADLANATRGKVQMITESYKSTEIRENLPEADIASIQAVKALSKDELYKAEVDYLLKNAVKDMAVDKHLNTRTNDAALLKEVEGEMNEYYREKAMSIFSLKNKKIRFAVKN